MSRVLASVLSHAFRAVQAPLYRPDSRPERHAPAKLALDVNVILDRKRFAMANDYSYQLRGW